MASIWKVSTPSGLNIRTGPGINYDKIITGTTPNGAFTNGTQLSAANDERAAGEDQYNNEWVHITEPVDGWVSKTYLTCLQEHTVETQTETVNETNATPQVVAAVTAATTTNTDTLESAETAVNNQYLKYMKAFGAPPQFTEMADPPIYSCDDPLYGTCGRVYAETFLQNPSVLSICPGKVHYLPNFTSDEQNRFFQEVADFIKDADSALMQRFDGGNKLSGKLYEFVPDYNEYINVVNLMCRYCAVASGIGDKFMPGTSIRLDNFDYAWFTTPEGNKNQQMDSPSIFGKAFNAATQTLESAITDSHYIHFFVTQNGTSASEDISTSTGKSFFEEALNGSGLDGAARNLAFLTGGSLEEDTGMTADIAAVFEGADSSWLKTFGSLASNYYKGGRLVFPQMIEECTYGKTISCSTKFVSVYGNKISRFLRCVVPACHLMAMAFPQQIADNMYSYPFLCRVSQPGYVNSDLAVITNMNIKMGGDDDTSWTVDGVSTDFEISFDITPLYMQMMSSSASHPFMAMGNTALIEYLGNMCGIDMKQNTIDLKIKNSIKLVENSIADIPANVGRSWFEGLAAMGEGWFKPLE